MEHNERKWNPKLFLRVLIQDIPWRRSMLRIEYWMKNTGCYIIIFLQNNCILSVKAHLPPSCFSISEIRMPLGLNGTISVIGQAADMVQLSSICMWELSDCWSWCQLTELSALLVQHLLSLPFKISSKITLWFSIEMKSYFLCRSMETKPKGLNLILNFLFVLEQQ